MKPKHHYIRTLVAGLLGTVALNLVTLSVLLVWANATITNTTTFVSTVDPLLQKPALQGFIAGKVSDQLLAAAPLDELANGLLSTQERSGATPDELQARVRTAVRSSVEQTLGSGRVAEAWRSTGGKAHAHLIAGLDGTAPNISLDFSAVAGAVIDELKATKLAPVAQQINFKPESAMVNLGGSQLVSVRQSYLLLKSLTWWVVVVAIICAGLAVVASVHHTKTFRRIMLGTGVIGLVLGALIALPSVALKPSAEPTTIEVASIITTTLLRNLMIGGFAMSAAGFVLALGSKAFEVWTGRGINRAR